MLHGSYVESEQTPAQVQELQRQIMNRKLNVKDFRPRRAAFATFPFTYPSWNAILAMHWSTRKKHHDKFLNATGLILKSLHITPFTTPVKIVVDLYFKNKRIRDIDNYGGKWMIDAIRLAGIIPDDSTEWIPEGPDVMIITGEGENKTIVKIEEV
jgi:Holliday junction resolvase RusA-like endonuclease